jgi:magnesium transporter
MESRSDQIRSITRYDLTGHSHALTLDRISDALEAEDSSLIWVGLFEPDETLLFKMQIEFNLHPLAIEDAHKAHQRSKVCLSSSIRHKSSMAQSFTVNHTFF